MQPFTTDLGLPFLPAEVVMGKLLKARILTRNDHPLHRLGKEELVVERNEATLVP